MFFKTLGGTFKTFNLIHFQPIRMWPDQSASFKTNRWKPRVRFSCDESQKLQIGSDRLIPSGSAARRQILLARSSNHLSSVFFPRRAHPFINIVSRLSSKTDKWNLSCAYGRLAGLKYKKTKHVFEWLVYRTGLHLRQRLFGKHIREHIIWIAVIGQVILTSWRSFWIAGQSGSDDSLKHHNDIWLLPSNCRDILRGSGDAASICTFHGWFDLSPVDRHILYGLKGWITRDSSWRHAAACF